MTYLKKRGDDKVDEPSLAVPPRRCITIAKPDDDGNDCENDDDGDGDVCEMMVMVMARTVLYVLDDVLMTSLN